MAFNVSNGIHIYKPLSMNNNVLSGLTRTTASVDIAGGTITRTTTGGFFFTSDNIQTQNGIVSGKTGVCQESCMRRNKKN